MDLFKEKLDHSIHSLMSSDPHWKQLIVDPRSTAQTPFYDDDKKSLNCN